MGVGVPCGFDDGVLLVIAKDDHRLRIEVGYGLEGALTDVTSKRIIDEIITPRFKAGDFAGGISAEVAYLECVGELKLIAELIEERGIAGMREAISNTAELGALLGGRRIVDASVRQRMADVLEEVRQGQGREQRPRQHREPEAAHLRPAAAAPQRR